MILGLEFTLFAYGVLAAVFALLRRVSEKLALAFLAVANVSLLWLANPLLLLYFSVQTGWVLLLHAFIVRQKNERSAQWAWLAFAGMLPLNLAVDIPIGWSIASEGLQRTVWEGVFWHLGASFFVLKSFVVLREALAGVQPIGLPSFVSLSFLPAFSAGPICGGQPWAKGQLSLHVDSRTLCQALLRFGWGAAALYVLAPRVKRLGLTLASTPGGEIIDMYLSFIALYLDFSSYSAIALATASVFGARLPENFDRPYLATSVKEFWRRWHMSMSSFIGQYLFKPLVRHTGSRWLGVTLAFTATGLWHEVSWRYLFWGLAHGLALAASITTWSSWNIAMKRVPPPIIAFIGWAFTMTYVASVSYLVQGWAQ